MRHERVVFAQRAIGNHHGLREVPRIDTTNCACGWRRNAAIRAVST